MSSRLLTTCVRLPRWGASLDMTYARAACHPDRPRTLRTTLTSFLDCLRGSVSFSDLAQGWLRFNQTTAMQARVIASAAFPLTTQAFSHKPSPLTPLLPLRATHVACNGGRPPGTRNLASECLEPRKSRFSRRMGIDPARFQLWWRLAPSWNLCRADCISPEVTRNTVAEWPKS